TAPPPSRCDVRGVGAGPAGSACARQLATAGLDVLLADQHAFPRDKVCGDGLIPDSHAALRRLGVWDEVAALARHVGAVRCVGPRGGQVDVPGTLAVLPRRQLDHILVRAAERAGARLLAPLRFEAPLEEAGRVVGARLRSAQGAHEIAARWVVLATGAATPPLIAAGLCERQAPSGIALRGYVRNAAMVERIRTLELAWHPRLRGGYGWIFPAPDGLFNIGTGLTGAHRGAQRERRAGDVNLRRMFEAFCAVYPPAAELMRGGEIVGAIKGAPLRCGLRGARWSRPGLLGTGEAVGSTYAFSGEGIGKAMETGMLAAAALVEGGSDDAVRQRYEAALRGLSPKFDLYEIASRVNQHPWLADLVVWRANKSPRIRRRLTGVLEETQNPGRLFTFSGITKLMFE
ncbi:MAG: NAD(P)/FAD-dependent oxidoreductase, partial [Burkholderiales bacterium]|nr:NAD(P)/FAD-dependent oxidoreductase [Burkholderiales bacterium]